MICYLYTFPNGKKYCGITHKTIEQRAASRYKGQKVGEAIAKYGWENVKKEILLESDDEEIIKKKEIAVIAELNLLDPNRGYNISPGGNMQPPEIRQKISQTIIALWQNDEYRNHMTEAAKKRIYTKERNQKISAALKQKFIDNPELHKQYSIKLKEAYRQGHREEAIKRSIEAKREPVAKYTQDGQLVAVFPSNIAAYREYHLEAKIDKAIYRVLNGTRNHYQGYIYKKITREQEEELNGILRSGNQNL